MFQFAIPVSMGVTIQRSRPWWRAAITADEFDTRQVLDTKWWAWMDSNQRPRSYQDPSRQYPVLSLARSSSLTNLDSPTNFVAITAPNTAWSLSLYDHAAKGLW